MNIFTLNVNTIDFENICFLDNKKNIIMNGTFSKIIYTTENYTMNGLYIYLPENFQFLNTIFLIEQKIMYYYSKTKLLNNDKIPVYSLPYGPLKPIVIGGCVIEKKSKNKVLKISGIWENGNNYGITYKMIDIF